MIPQEQPSVSYPEVLGIEMTLFGDLGPYCREAKPNRI